MTKDRYLIPLIINSSHCHLFINQVSFNHFCTFQDMARTGNNYEIWEITQYMYIYRIGLCFLGSALIAIYLYTKFYLNANSSFKVIWQTRYRTDGRTKRGIYASTFGEHKKRIRIMCNYVPLWSMVSMYCCRDLGDTVNTSSSRWAIKVGENTSDRCSCLCIVWSNTGARTTYGNCNKASQIFRLNRSETFISKCTKKYQILSN